MPPPPLKLGQIHLWDADLDRLARQASRLEESLSADETARADRFFSRRDRERFIACRGLLRALLGGYLSRSPRTLDFVYGPQGKPGLSERGLISFNVSHCAQRALLGFIRGDRAFGVDLERARPMPDGLRIAKSFFAESEVGRLRALPEGERDRAFFLLWTRKEAYLKACGDGLSRPLSDVEIAGDDPSRPAAIAIPAAPESARDWRLRSLLLEDGFIASIALRGKPAPVRAFRLDALGTGGPDGWASIGGFSL